MNKRLICVITAAALLILAVWLYVCVYRSGSIPVSSSADGFKVIIDAGHGGFDGGAVRNGIAEAPLNLAVALKLQKRFEESGAEVVMTRSDSEALSDTKKTDMALRSRIVAQDCSVVVSIHQNAHTGSSAYGPTVYYKPKDDQSTALAECVRQALTTQLSIEKPRETQPGDFLILNSAKSPAIMVECGFLSNNADLQRLCDEAYQQSLANAIASGIMEYFGVDR